MSRNTRLMYAFGLSTGLCMLLLITRWICFDDFGYFFLAWNLFLAWIPLWAASAYESGQKKKRRWVILAIATWLVFFPNAPYIITDLFHLRFRSDIPVWFDTMLIVSFAWTGLMIGFWSLYKMHFMLEQYFSVRTTWLIVGLLILLCGYGIYLGRFERWNSWEVVTDPTALFSNCLDHLIHPFKNSKVYSRSILFSVFLLIGYMTTYSFIKTEKHEQ